MTSISRAKLKSMGNHDKFLNRITKSLYYTKLPMTDCLSLPVTELAAELFTEVKSGHTLERLDMEEASKISRNACVSPCSLVLALLYLERLKDCNPEYLQRVAPSELFLVSLMVASKFLNDDGEEDEVFNAEWALSGDLTISYMNQLEKDFLKAIDWSVFVRNQDFWDRLQRLERDIAYKEGQKRGWFSYTELSCLINSAQLTNIAHALINVSSICLATYAAGVATLFGSALVASYLPGSILTPRQSGNVVNNGSIADGYNVNRSITDGYNVGGIIANEYNNNDGGYDIDRSPVQVSVANRMVAAGCTTVGSGYCTNKNNNEMYTDQHNINSIVANRYGINKTVSHGIVYPNNVKRILVNEYNSNRNILQANSGNEIIKQDVINGHNASKAILSEYKTNGNIMNENATNSVNITSTVADKNKSNEANISWTTTNSYSPIEITIRNRMTPANGNNVNKAADENATKELFNCANAIISSSNFEPTVKLTYQSSMMYNKTRDINILAIELNKLLTELESENLKSELDLDWQWWLDSAMTWLPEYSGLNKENATMDTAATKTVKTRRRKAPEAMMNIGIREATKISKRKQATGIARTAAKIKLEETIAEARSTQVTEVETTAHISHPRITGIIIEGKTRMETKSNMAEKIVASGTTNKHKYLLDPYPSKSDDDLMVGLKWREIFGVKLKFLLHDWRYYLAKILVG